MSAGGIRGVPRSDEASRAGVRAALKDGSRAVSAAGGAGPGVGDDDLIAQGARAIMRASGISEALLEQYWPGEIAHYREMVAKHGDRYASSGSTITDAMRSSRAALEAFRAAAPGPDRGDAERLTIREAQYRDRCTDLEREVAAAEARAERAERERDAAYKAANMCADVAAWWSTKARASLAEIAAQLGGPAPEGEPVCRDFRQTAAEPDIGIPITKPEQALAAGRPAARRAVLEEAVVAVEAEPEYPGLEAVVEREMRETPFWRNIAQHAPHEIAMQALRLGCRETKASVAAAIRALIHKEQP